MDAVPIQEVLVPIETSNVDVDHFVVLRHNCANGFFLSPVHQPAAVFAPRCDELEQYTLTRVAGATTCVIDSLG